MRHMLDKCRTLAEARYMTTTTDTVTIGIYTNDAAWVAEYSIGQDEGRQLIAGCAIVEHFTFFKKEWVRFRLPQGVRIPRDHEPERDKNASKGATKGFDKNVLTAKASYVRD